MARHSNPPKREFTLELKNKDGTTAWSKTVISRGTAYSVALEQFSGAQPGELHEGNTYRYPISYGFLYVTVGEEVSG